MMSHRQTPPHTVGQDKTTVTSAQEFLVTVESVSLVLGESVESG